MSDFFKKLKKARSEVKLEAHAKQTARGRLISFMQEHPLPVGHQPRITLVQAKPQRRSFWGALMRPATAGIVALVVILAGAGVSFAAQNALPTSPFLYAVKLNVNEQAQTLLAFTPQAKAQVAASQAQERLTEASELAASGKLSDAINATLQSNFQAETQTANTQIAKLRASGNVQAATDISAKFEASLRAQQSILESIQNKSQGRDKIKVAALAAHVALVVQNVDRIQRAAEHRGLGVAITSTTTITLPSIVSSTTITATSSSSSTSPSFPPRRHLLQVKVGSGSGTGLGL